MKKEFFEKMQMKVFPQTKLSWIYNLCNFREIWNDDGDLKNLGNNKTKKEERKKWNKILLLEIFLSGGIFWSSVSTGDFLKNLWDIRQALFSTQPLSNGRFLTKKCYFLGGSAEPKQQGFIRNNIKLLEKIIFGIYSLFLGTYY